MTKIAVLKGGLSSEREVSINTAASVVEALESKGYDVVEIDVGHDVAEQLKAANPKAAFNALHGTYGEDGCVQGVLEFLQIPYTHSGVLASAVAMHKPMSKKLFSAVGIPVAGSKIVSRPHIIGKDNAIIDVMKRPYVVKPIDEGSSVGVLIVHDGDEVTVEDENFPKAHELMIEEFIEGQEVTVAVLNGEAMGVLEIRPKEGFYDYRNKYTAGMTEYIVPAEISEEMAEKVMQYAEHAHIALGCRGVSRSDFRIDAKGNAYILELNTHPGMTSTSLVPKIAAHAGLEFPDLIELLVQSATLDHA